MNCGTLSDGCCGTLTCGSCTAPQTCAGNGVFNVGGNAASTATMTLSATGRSGESVFSTPSGLTIAVDSTGSATFAVGTKITLQATNGPRRDLVRRGRQQGRQNANVRIHTQANTTEMANVQ